MPLVVLLSWRRKRAARLLVYSFLRWNRARIVLDDLIGAALDGSHRFQRLNPGVEIDWRLSPAVTVRAGYAESNRAPTPAELACADEEAPCSLTNFFVADPPLEQVVARSFELGGQGRIGQVEWVVTAYRTTNEDDIQFVASDTRGRAFFRNISKTRRQGVEAALAYRSRGLTLRAGYAFTDATFRSPLRLNAPDNPQADESGRILVEADDRLPGVPRHRGVLTAGYDTGNWSLGADVQAASGQYLFGDEANLERRTDDYAIVNLRGSLRLAGPLTLFGEVRNLFDTRYASAIDSVDVRVDEALGELVSTGEVQRTFAKYGVPYLKP
jgi:iron complex outermembrane recepter protein